MSKCRSTYIYDELEYDPGRVVVCYDCGMLYNKKLTVAGLTTWMHSGTDSFGVREQSSRSGRDEELCSAIFNGDKPPFGSIFALAHDRLAMMRQQ